MALFFAPLLQQLLIHENLMNVENVSSTLFNPGMFLLKDFNLINFECLNLTGF
jgi:hypothetical protein